MSSVVGVSSGTPPPPAFAERRPEASGGAVPRPLPSTLSHARGHGCARSGVQGGRPCPRERTALRTRRAAGRGPQPAVRQTLRDLRRPTLVRVRAPGWVFLLSLRPAGHRIPWPPSSGMARGATLPAEDRRCPPPSPRSCRWAEGALRTCAAWRLRPQLTSVRLGYRRLSSWAAAPAGL